MGFSDIVLLVGTFNDLLYHIKILNYLLASSVFVLYQTQNTQ